MKNVFLYIGAGLVILGSIIGALTGTPAATWLELAGAAAALAACVASVITKAKDRRDWKLYTAIAAIIIGVILLIWAGIAESLVTSIIAAVIGVVVLVLSIIPVVKSNKNK